MLNIDYKKLLDFNYIKILNDILIISLLLYQVTPHSKVPNFILNLFKLKITRVLIVALLFFKGGNYPDTPLPLGKTWKGPSFKSTIDVLEKQLSKNTSSIELDNSLSRKNIESTFLDIDWTFQKMWNAETSVRNLIAQGGEPLFGDADQEAIDIAERNKEQASRGGTATSIILNMANGKDVKYEEHPVIIQIPKKGDTKLKEVLGPLKGGSSFDGSTVKNCVHTDAFGSDKFVLRDFEGHPANPYIMFTKTGVHGNFKNKKCPKPPSSKENIDILVNWLNSPKNKTFIEQNKKLAYQIYQLWPRCRGLKISF